MAVDRSDVNRENSRQYYDRVVHHCTVDDTWVTVETPVPEENS